MMMKSRRRRFKRHHLSFYFSPAKKNETLESSLSSPSLSLSLRSGMLSSEKRAKTLALFCVKKVRRKCVTFFPSRDDDCMTKMSFLIRSRVSAISFASSMTKAKRTRTISTKSAFGVTTSESRFSLSSLSSETTKKEMLFLSFPRGRSSIGGEARRFGGWWSSSSYSSRSAKSLGGSHSSPNNKPSDLDASYLPLYAADWARVDLPPGHRFPMEKYLLTREAIEKESPDFLKYSMRFSPTARKEDVLLVHDKEYVERVLTQKLTREEARTIGFPMSEQSDGYASKFLSEDETKRGEQHVTRSLASTGGTIKMTRDVLEYGFMWAGQLAGGTHHAFAGHGEGFCVFNDIACAVRVAQRDYEELFEGEDRNVLIVDLDVHQGNGTAKIFENDKNIITYSIHGDRNYPWKTRMLSDYDIALPDDCEDEEYLNALETSLPKVFEKHKPFLVYFQAGVDALKADSFGRLSMTREGLRRRNNLVLALCVEHDCKLVTTMGGGYAKPIERSIECHSDVFRIMALKHKAIMEERKYLEKMVT